jgi:hypothetical protein
MPAQGVHPFAFPGCRCDLDHRIAQPRLPGRARLGHLLTVRVGHAEAILEPSQREIARDARCLHLVRAIRDDKPLAFAFACIWSGLT